MPLGNSCEETRRHFNDTVILDGSCSKNAAARSARISTRTQDDDDECYLMEACSAATTTTTTPTASPADGVCIAQDFISAARAAPREPARRLEREVSAGIGLVRPAAAAANSNANDVNRMIMQSLIHQDVDSIVFPVLVIKNNKYSSQSFPTMAPNSTTTVSPSITETSSPEAVLHGGGGGSLSPLSGGAFRHSVYYANDAAVGLLGYDTINDVAGRSLDSTFSFYKSEILDAVERENAAGEENRFSFGTSTSPNNGGSSDAHHSNNNSSSPSSGLPDPVCPSTLFEVGQETTVALHAFMSGRLFHCYAVSVSQIHLSHPPPLSLPRTAMPTPMQYVVELPPPQQQPPLPYVEEEPFIMVLFLHRASNTALEDFLNNNLNNGSNLCNSYHHLYHNNNNNSSGSYQVQTSLLTAAFPLATHNSLSIQSPYNSLTTQQRGDSEREGSHGLEHHLQLHDDNHDDEAAGLENIPPAAAAAGASATALASHKKGTTLLTGPSLESLAFDSGSNSFTTNLGGKGAGAGGAEDGEDSSDFSMALLRPQYRTPLVKSSSATRSKQSSTNSGKSNKRKTTNSSGATKPSPCKTSRDGSPTTHERSTTHSSHRHSSNSMGNVSTGAARWPQQHQQRQQRHGSSNGSLIVQNHNRHPSSSISSGAVKSHLLSFATSSGAGGGGGGGGAGDRSAESHRKASSHSNNSGGGGGGGGGGAGGADSYPQHRASVHVDSADTMLFPDGNASILRLQHRANIADHESAESFRKKLHSFTGIASVTLSARVPADFCANVITLLDVVSQVIKFQQTKSIHQSDCFVSIRGMKIAIDLLPFGKIPVSASLMHTSTSLQQLHNKEELQEKQLLAMGTPADSPSKLRNTTFANEKKAAADRQLRLIDGVISPSPIPPMPSVSPSDGHAVLSASGSAAGVAAHLPSALSQSALSSMAHGCWSENGGARTSTTTMQSMPFRSPMSNTSDPYGVMLDVSNNNCYEPLSLVLRSAALTDMMHACGGTVQVCSGALGSARICFPYTTEARLSMLSQIDTVNLSAQKGLAMFGVSLANALTEEAVTAAQAPSPDIIPLRYDLAAAKYTNIGRKKNVAIVSPSSPLAPDYADDFAHKAAVLAVKEEGGADAGGGAATTTTEAAAAPTTHKEQRLKAILRRSSSYSNNTNKSARGSGAGSESHHANSNRRCSERGVGEDAEDDDDSWCIDENGNYSSSKPQQVIVLPPDAAAGGNSSGSGGGGGGGMVTQDSFALVESPSNDLDLVKANAVSQLPTIFMPASVAAVAAATETPPPVPLAAAAAVTPLCIKDHAERQRKRSSVMTDNVSGSATPSRASKCTSVATGFADSARVMALFGGYQLPTATAAALGQCSTAIVEDRSFTHTTMTTTTTRSTTGERGTESGRLSSAGPCQLASFHHSEALATAPSRTITSVPQFEWTPDGIANDSIIDSYADLFRASPYKNINNTTITSSDTGLGVEGTETKFLHVLIYHPDEHCDVGDVLGRYGHCATSVSTPHKFMRYLIAGTSVFDLVLVEWTSTIITPTIRSWLLDRTMEQTIVMFHITNNDPNALEPHPSIPDDALLRSDNIVSAFVNCQTAEQTREYLYRKRLMKNMTEVRLRQSYQIVRQIGSGGFGDVFEVIMFVSRGRLAMKRIFLKSVAVRTLEMLNREVTILSTLDHPNVITFSHSRLDEDSYSMFMELCDGTLAERLWTPSMARTWAQRDDSEFHNKPFLSASIGTANSNDTTQQHQHHNSNNQQQQQQQQHSQHQSTMGLSARDAVLIVHDIASAVSYIHGMDIIHRDLKPENVLFANGVAKLADFGSAVKVHERRALTNMKGTLAYMSPEVLIGEPYGKPCDMWSFGCLLADIMGLRLGHLNGLHVPGLIELYKSIDVTDSLPITITNKSATSNNMVNHYAQSTTEDVLKAMQSASDTASRERHEAAFSSHAAISTNYTDNNNNNTTEQSMSVLEGNGASLKVRDTRFSLPEDIAQQMPMLLHVDPQSASPSPMRNRAAVAAQSQNNNNTNNNTNNNNTNRVSFEVAASGSTHGSQARAVTCISTDNISMQTTTTSLPRSLIELFEGLFHRDPAKRMTIADVLEHPVSWNVEWMSTMLEAIQHASAVLGRMTNNNSNDNGGSTDEDLMSLSLRSSVDSEAEAAARELSSPDVPCCETDAVGDRE